MNQEEQIQKILELEESIRQTQTSKISAHTLMPIGLVITVVGFSFAFGINYQDNVQTKAELASFKQEYKQDQAELKDGIKSLSSRFDDLRVVILSNPSFSNK